MLPKSSIEQIPNVKVMIPVGATFDIPTGTYMKGIHGENVLNAGYGSSNSVIGRPNSFKSTIGKYMMLSAANLVASAHETAMFTYDTEMSAHTGRLLKLSKQFPAFAHRDIIEDGTWSVTDKTYYWGDEYHEKMKAYLKEKRALGDSVMIETVYLDRDGKPMKIMLPTFEDIDSLTMWETRAIAEIQDKIDLSDTSGNTIHMKNGLAKTRLLMDLPHSAVRNYHYMMLTAHIVSEMNIQSGPVSLPPPRKLSYMKSGEKIKGATDNFYYLMANCWQAISTSPLINPTTKAPEYPVNTDDNNNPSTDLHIVTLKQLRGKSGQSGVMLDIIVSQALGVLPTLTEFHSIKSTNRFGLEGNVQNYSLSLLPDVKLSRTTVRSKIDANPQLRRAIKITSELLQMRNLWRDISRDFICEPKVLYEDLKQKGYDWNMILSLDDHNPFLKDNPVPTISTWDLLCMRLDANHPDYYFPYWMNTDKTIKPEYDTNARENHGKAKRTKSN